MGGIKKGGVYMKTQETHFKVLIFISQNSLKRLTIVTSKRRYHREFPVLSKENYIT